MNIKFLTGTILAGAGCLAAFAAGAPRLQFEQTTYDFGKTSQVQTVSGIFKFKNTGDATLKVEPPKPSCGCTVASLNPDVLEPGQTGELAFSLNLGIAKARLEKRIVVASNDPQTPELSLVIQADYTPLYEMNPIVLAPVLAFGDKDNEQFATITRTDGKPIQIERLEASKPWITAQLEVGPATNDTTARIRVNIQREGTPRHFNEFIHVYALGQTNSPVSTIYLAGQVMGEVSLTPDALYWSVSAGSVTQSDRPEATALRRVTIRSADGKELSLKNPQSSIKGIKVELVAREPGKVYELVARLDEAPASSVSGLLSFESSVAAQSRIEVPVIVNVVKP